jgi:hypothetical protein
MFSNNKAQEESTVKNLEETQISFDQLGPVERVEAVLAAVKIPVSEAKALKMAGVDWSDLDTDGMSKLKELLEDNQVTEDRFKADEGSNVLEKLGVDPKTVHLAITKDSMAVWNKMKNLG